MNKYNTISRIWIPAHKSWYNELRVIYPYREFQYDRIIRHHLTTLFPEYYTIDYARVIRQLGRKDGSKPDFAMIRKDFKEWWIVEVERIEDILKAVKTQIEDFTGGTYNNYTEAKYLHKNAPHLNLKKLQEVTSENPKVLLIVDDINSLWIEELQTLNPTTCVFKVFRNSKAQEILSISGDYPYIYEDNSPCHFQPGMQNLLLLVNPDVLDPIMNKSVPTFWENAKNKAKELWSRKPPDDFSVKINFQGQITNWEKVEQDGKTYLQAVGPVNTRANDTYTLHRTDTKEFILKLN